MERGGFPEPFLAIERQDSDRWRMQYIDGIVGTDLLSFEKINDLRAIQLTLELLRNRVGSPLSFKSIAEDVGCSPHTIKRYIEILEALYIVFRVTPYSRNIARSLLKEPKIYFYDTGLIQGNDGVCFENLVAVSLLKHVNAIEDYEGRKAGLHYLRTKEKKEVDFCVVEEEVAPLLMEVKLSDQSVDASLKYFHRKYHFKSIQVVKHLRQEFLSGKIEVRKGVDFLRSLQL